MVIDFQRINLRKEDFQRLNLIPGHRRKEPGIAGTIACRTRVCVCKTMSLCISRYNYIQIKVIYTTPTVL